MSTDKLKMLLGFLLIVILAGLALVFALGKVEEKTSHGLMPIITTLSTLAGGFTNWAFGSKVETKSSDDQNHKI